MVPECSRVRAVPGTRVSAVPGTRVSSSLGWGGGRGQQGPLSPFSPHFPAPLPAPVAPIILAHLPAASLMQGPELGASVTAALTVTLLPFLALAAAMQGS